MTVSRLRLSWRFSRNERSGEPGAVQPAHRSSICSMATPLREPWCRQSQERPCHDFVPRFAITVTYWGVIGHAARRRGRWASLARSRCRSRRVRVHCDQRARGIPRRAGSSHARALTSTTTLGGKAGWAPASRLFLEAGQSLGTEPLAPLADDLARGIQARCDDVIGETLGGERDDLRPDDRPIRRRISSPPCTELLPLRLG